MSSTVYATCPSCGQVQMTSNDVWLRVCINAPSLSSFGFQCPACHQPVVKPACDHVISMLTSVAITPEVWHVPLEVFEPHDGPPISRDDLLDLALALKSGDIWAELA